MCLQIGEELEHIRFVGFFVGHWLRNRQDGSGILRLRNRQ